MLLTKRTVCECISPHYHMYRDVIEINAPPLYVQVCVCACVRACVRVCACVCVCVHACVCVELTVFLSSSPLVVPFSSANLSTYASPYTTREEDCQTTELVTQLKPLKNGQHSEVSLHA